MVKISYDEFMKLSDKEKCIRYKDMDDYDRFRARVTQDWGKQIIVGEIEMTKEQKEINSKKMKEIKEKIRKNNEISRNSND